MHRLHLLRLLRHRPHPEPARPAGCRPGGAGRAPGALGTPDLGGDRAAAAAGLQQDDRLPAHVHRDRGRDDHRPRRRPRLRRRRDRGPDRLHPPRPGRLRRDRLRQHHRRRARGRPAHRPEEVRTPRRRLGRGPLGGGHGVLQPVLHPAAGRRPVPGAPAGAAGPDGDRERHAPLDPAPARAVADPDRGVLLLHLQRPRPVTGAAVDRRVQLPAGPQHLEPADRPGEPVPHLPRRQRGHGRPPDGLDAPRGARSA